jgi:hypothetical protein
MTETDAYILGFFAYWDKSFENPFWLSNEQIALYTSWNKGYSAALAADYEVA